MSCCLALVDGLCSVFQQVEQHLLQFVGGGRHRGKVGGKLALDVQALEVEAFGQVEVIAGNLDCLIEQRWQLTRRQLAIAEAAEIKHMADNLCRTAAGLLDAVEQTRNFPGIQVAVDGFQADACLLRLFAVFFQLG